MTGQGGGSAPSSRLPVLTVFHRSPDRGRGLARDMRVRWALEELGLPYRTDVVPLSGLKDPAHVARHPFGQIPVWRDGDLVLFESGAIVLHLARQAPGLFPEDPVARARAEAWVFAALSTVEPPMMDAESARFFEGEEPWYAERKAHVDRRIAARLDQLAAWLGDRDWLEADFTAGDLMMVAVLLRFGREALEDHPTLQAYLDRGTARPAFTRAFAAQKAEYEASLSD